MSSTRTCLHATHVQLGCHATRCALHLTVCQQYSSLCQCCVSCANKRSANESQINPEPTCTAHTTVAYAILHISYKRMAAKTIHNQPAHRTRAAQSRGCPQQPLPAHWPPAPSAAGGAWRHSPACLTACLTRGLTRGFDQPLTVCLTMSCSTRKPYDVDCQVCTSEKEGWEGGKRIASPTCLCRLLPSRSRLCLRVGLAVSSCSSSRLSRLVHELRLHLSLEVWAGMERYGMTWNDVE